MFYRDTWAQINLDNFNHNLAIMKKHTNKAIICVLKANAYGHGDLHIAKEAMQNQCVYVAVSSLDEAIALRKQAYEGPILILGYTNSKDIDTVLKENITLTVVSKQWVESLCQSDHDLSTLKVHLKVDTGMNRIGIKKVNELIECLHLLKEKQIEIEGIYTHYHSADQQDKAYCIKQQNWFYHILDTLQYPFKWIHTSNSDASISFHDERSNAIRIGLALYGVKSMHTDLDLKPVLSLYTKISCCKQIMKNETVGYGATYTCKENDIIATLPIGYGDGFIRANQGRFVCIEGHPYEIVGRVCMDQCMIKVDKMYPVSTTVEIIGEFTSIETMAQQLNTIPYEVLCLLNDRIPRIFIKHNTIIDTQNRRLI